MAKSKKNKKLTDLKQRQENQKQTEAPTWQQIAQARKPTAQKALDLLDDPTKHLVSPKEEVMLKKEIKFKTRPDPTHMIVTELSAPRRIASPADAQSPKKVLKSTIVQQETRILDPDELENLKKEMQFPSIEKEVNTEIEDNPIKELKETAKKLMKVFSKKKPESKNERE